MSGVYRDLLRKGLTYGLGSSLNGLAGLILIPFILRHLSAAEYGKYALTEGVLGVLLTISSLGLNVALLTLYFQVEPTKRKQLFTGIFTAVILASGLVILLFSSTMLVLRAFDLEPINYHFWRWLAVIVPLEALWLQFSSYYRAENRAKRFVALSLLQLIISCAGSVLLIIYSTRQAESILISRAIADATILAIACIHGRKLFASFDRQLVMKAIKVGLPIVPITFSAVWIVMAPRFLLGLFSTSSEVGIYAISSRIAGVVSIVLVQPLGTLWLPAAFRIKLRADAESIFKHVLESYILLGSAIVLLVAIMAPYISIYFGNSSFPLNDTLIVLLASSLIISGASYLVCLGPFFSGQTKRALPAYLFSAVLMIAVGIPLVKFGAAYGAAISSLVCVLTQSVALDRISQKTYQVYRDPRRLFVISVFIGLLYVAFFYTVLQLHNSSTAMVLLLLPIAWLLLERPLAIKFGGTSRE